MKPSAVVLSSSPGREKMPLPPGLTHFLSRKCSAARSRGRSSSAAAAARSSPIFFSRSRSRGRAPSAAAAAAAAEEEGEPSSPMVTCIGQVRIRSKGPSGGGALVPEAEGEAEAEEAETTRGSESQRPLVLPRSKSEPAGHALPRRLDALPRRMESRDSHKWLPVVKDRLKIIASHIRFHMQSLTDNVHEAHTRCQTTIVPHFLTVQMFLDPYFQRAKKHWDANINWIASITKPHVKEFLIFFGPCKKLLVCAYQKFFDSAVAYHYQVQAIILKTLERHERSKPLATKDFVWLMATALLAFPIYLVYWLILVFFSKHWRVTRRTRTGQASRRQKSQRVVKESRAS